MPEDRFANQVGLQVTESSAGTLTFKEQLTGTGFSTGQGFLFDEIDYFIPNDTLKLVIGQNDLILMGITTSTGVTDLEDVTDSRIIHSAAHVAQVVGTAGTFFVHKQPDRNQFFPPLILGGQRFYLAVQSASIASPATVRARVYWRFVDLKKETIAELVHNTLLQG